MQDMVRAFKLPNALKSHNIYGLFNNTHKRSIPTLILADRTEISFAKKKTSGAQLNLRCCLLQRFTERAR
jgi:hypothetical protein